jgi:hypothetical protein
MLMAWLGLGYLQIIYFDFFNDLSFALGKFFFNDRNIYLGRVLMKWKNVNFFQKIIHVSYSVWSIGALHLNVPRSVELTVWGKRVKTIKRIFLYL